MSEILAYIVEPKNGGPVYLTYKQAVAEKRTKAGDMVTPYTTRFQPGEKFQVPENDSDEL
jgi:hypothetical protein